jgi:hypothetical protein
MRRCLVEVAMHGHFSGFGGFPTVCAADADSSRAGQFFDSGRPHVGDNYARITARTGWTPMMFMTRVRL